MPNEILIPVRRRHATSRANLEAIVTRAKHWGYTEDEDLILIRRANKARRYFSRSSLMEPGSVYTQMLECTATEITVNVQGDDVNFRVQSNDYDDALFVEGDDGHVGIKTDAIPAYPNAWAVLALGEQENLFATAGQINMVENTYYTGANWPYIANGGASRVFLIGTTFEVNTAVAGVAGGLITWVRNIQAQPGTVTINPGGIDMDFMVITDNETYALFVQGSSDNIGMGTDEPLINITGTAAFDVPGRGLHMVGDSVAPYYSNLVIEGWDAEESIGRSAGIYLVDRSADANSRTIYYYSHNDIGGFDAIGDDGDIDFQYMLAFDLKTGCVGVGTSTISAKLYVDQASDSGAMPVLALDQADIDDSFVNFIGTSAADGTRSISSDTTEDSAKFGAVKIEINGVAKWIRIYDDWS